MHRLHFAIAAAALLVLLTCSRHPTPAGTGVATTTDSGATAHTAPGGGMMGHGMMGGGMMGSQNPGPQKTQSSQPSDKAITFRIASVDNSMAFDTTTLKVKQGQQVRLVFHNEATVAALPHNWVLVEPGTATAVASAGIQAGKSHDYVPDSPDVIAHAKLAAPGETVDVTFTAPKPGTYPYICTVPGHAAVMKGQLLVGS